MLNHWKVTVVLDRVHAPRFTHEIHGDVFEESKWIKIADENKKVIKYKKNAVLYYVAEIIPEKAEQNATNMAKG